jgi:4-amino-4-deoxy-L-arabinose transferase-like glycosyltransferase
MITRDAESDAKGSRLSWVTLLLLMALALVLRWRYIQEISLFVDEFVTAWAARNVLVRGLPIFPSGNLYPHGLTFTYLVVPFVVGEFSESLARVPALLVGLAALPLVYWAGRQFFSDQAGLIAAAAIAVDPAHIIWGSRIRMYGLLQILTLLVLSFYYRGLVKDSARDRYAAMVLLVLAIFTHAEAAFLVPVLALVSLVICPWRQLLRWSVVGPFAFAAAGAGVFYLLARFGQPGHLETLQETRPYLALSPGLVGSLSGAAQAEGLRAFSPVFTSLHRLPFSLLSLAGLYFLFRPGFARRSPLTYLYVALFGTIILLVFLAGATWQRERYLFLILPAFFLIGSEVLLRFLALLPLPSQSQRWIPAALAVLVALYVGASGTGAAYVQEWGYDQAFRYLRDQELVQPEDRIATSMSAASLLYLGRNDAFVIQQGYEEYVIQRPSDGVAADLWTATPILTTTVAFTEMLEQDQAVWFITDGWRFQTRYQADFVQTVLDQMDQEYDQRGVMVFRGEGYAPPSEPLIWRERKADFDGEMALTGFGLSASEVKPGDDLDITLKWQALGSAQPAYTVFLHIVDADGNRVAGIDEPLLRGVYQPDLWPAGIALSDRHRLTLPPDLLPGTYRLDVGLYHPGQSDQPLRVEGRSHVPLATLIAGDMAEAPRPAESVEVTFGDQLLLSAYDLECDAAGLTCDLRLHWQATGPVDRNYTVFVHLVGPDGAILAQSDAPPGGVHFPTSTWLPGHAVLDIHSLALPAHTEPGDYALLVGLYHQPTAERLLATDASGNPLGDASTLTILSLGSGSP